MASGEAAVPASIPRRDVREVTAAGSSGARVEEVRTVARLRDVAAAWGELWERSPNATPFTSSEWLLPWCEHLLEGDPWAFLVWRGETLVALLPSFVYRSGRRRVVGLLGGGVSDYQDVLAEDAAAVDLLLTHLTGRTSHFDDIVLEALPPDSLLLAARVSRPLHVAVSAQEVCPVLSLPGEPAEVERRASPRLLADVRYQRRRLERAGRFTVVRTRDGTLGPALDDLFRLHRARWGVRGQPGVLTDGAVAAFHRDASRTLLARGMLRTYVLLSRGSTLGVLHGFTAHRRAYAYLPAMDPEASRYSPGSVLFAHAIQEAIAEGCLEFDFLRGAEPYKYRWGAVDRVTSRLSLESEQRPIGPHLDTGTDAAAP